MKKIYDEFFRIVEGEKIRDKVMMARAIFTVAVISACMIAMGFTAYAFFSYNISSGVSTIRAANYNLDVAISEVASAENAEGEAEQTGVLAENAEGYYVLENPITTTPVEDNEGIVAMSETTEGQEAESNSEATEGQEAKSNSEATEEGESGAITETVVATAQDKIFKIAISKSKDSTASVGYAKIEILTDVNLATDGTYKESQVYYTTPIGEYLENGATVENLDYMISIKVPAGQTAKVKVIAKWGTCAKGPIVEDGAAIMPDYTNSKYMHLAIDDVEYSLTNLVNNKAFYTSIYDEPFFAWLKDLHETYGAKFSLYTYTSVLDTYVTAMGATDGSADVFATYKTEFAEAKDWLKFGLHAVDKNSDFSEETLTQGSAPEQGNATVQETLLEQGKAAWNTFVSRVVAITGTSDSVDRMPRLTEFVGAKDALLGMQAAECGALGFLTTDDDRQSYYLAEDVCDFLYTNDYYVDQVDAEKQLVFIASDLRIDWFEEGFSSDYTYRVPETLRQDDPSTTDVDEYHASIYDELCLRYGYKEGVSNEDYVDSLYSCIIYGHEWQFYNADEFIEKDNTATLWKTWYEEACRFANEHYVNFNYPQTRAFEVVEIPKPQTQSESNAEGTNADANVDNSAGADTNSNVNGSTDSNTSDAASDSSANTEGNTTTQNTTTTENTEIE